MNISTTSNCSSGCESAWTMYFDQSSNSADQFEREDYTSKRANVVVVQLEQDDEDMSMVSDASSGLRQLNNDDDGKEEEEFYESRGGYFGYASQQRSTSKQKNIKEYRGKHLQSYSCLDDTASSHILSISKENDQGSMEQVTSFKGKSTLKKHFGFFKYSGPGKSSSKRFTREKAAMRNRNGASSKAAATKLSVTKELVL